jgi:Arc/MetJ-type ribon-helix-helix transcriptional regulator
VSEGTPRHTFRLEDELVAEVVKTVHKRNTYTGDVPWTISDFVRIALREKLDKMARSRTRNRVSDTPPSKQEWAEPATIERETPVATDNDS